MEEWLEDVKMPDCCETDKNLKGGNIKMDTKSVVLWVVIAILVIAVVYVVFFRGGSTGSAISAGQSAGQVVSSGMVGGC